MIEHPDIQAKLGICDGEMEFIQNIVKDPTMQESLENMRLSITKYLLDHEAQIAHMVEDYGHLGTIFEVIFVRPPEG